MQEEINKIWQEHHDKLLGFIRKRVSDKTVAEDLLHDVFLKMRDKIGQLKDSEKIQSWMYRIAHHTVVDYFREQQKNQNRLISVYEEESGEEVNRMAAAENWIGSYVQALPDNYREAVVLFEMEGKSVAEVAEQLQISYTNARARVQRGRNALKKSLLDCCTFHVDRYGNIIDYHRNAPRNCVRNECSSSLQQTKTRSYENKK